MRFTHPDSRNTFFWLMQFLFWFTQATVTIIASPKIASSLTDTLISSLWFVVAFVVSCLLMVIYNKLRIYFFSPGALITSIIFCSLVCSVVTGLTTSLIDYIAYGVWYSILLPPDLRSFPIRVWYNAYPYIIWSALYLAYKIYDEWKSQNQRAEQALALAQRAQLEVLRYQINPHFFFNTLNSLYYLVNKDTDEAKEMIIKISEFMRYSLLAGHQQEVPLAREIESIQHYLTIEKVRFNGKIQVEYDIDQSLNNFPVPVFILHPLVENAIKHGMRSSPKPLQIQVNARTLDSFVYVEVVSSGKWIEPQLNSESTQTGLSNIRQRLEHHCPGNSSLEILKGEESVRAVIRMKKETKIGDKEVTGAHRR